jgi:type 1 glutamine amidotransferase
MSGRVLVIAGGWSGHSPRPLARLISTALEAHGCEVTVETRLSAFDDAQRLRDADLVVPLWTMGNLSWERSERLRDAVAAGTGLGGVHGSGDAFRSATEYQYVLGGQFVAHPGGDARDYEVEIAQPDHPITRGLPAFRVRSEQYYLHVDPSIDVLATTRFPTGDERSTFAMPVAWTRRFGAGRVFYCSLGHTPAVVADGPAHALAVRGLLWAAGCEQALAAA